MISDIVVELSRCQIAVTTLFQFLSVPLTLALSLMIAWLESVYLLTGKTIYKTACLFLSRLFAINFALWVAAKLAVLFQFGISSSYLSHFSGDVFALPLAVDMFSAFFLASVLFGPFLFGWEHLGKRRHLLITCLICLAVNASTVISVFTETWLQNPVGGAFNYQSFRLELTDFMQILDNPFAAFKVLQDIAVSYVIATTTLLALCALLLLKNPKDAVPITICKPIVVLGFMACLLLCLTFALPYHGYHPSISNPAVLAGNENSNSLPTIEARIRNGIKAYALLQELRDENKDPQLHAEFERLKADLGYGLLLQRWAGHIVDATDKQISLAAHYSLPAHPMLVFWVYRFMMVCGILTLLLFTLACWGFFSKTTPQVWLLKLSLFFLPLPWLAVIGEWFITKDALQPWAIAEILPAFLSASSLSVTEWIFSLFVSVITYAALLTVGLFLMRQTLQKHAATQNQGAVL